MKKEDELKGPAESAGDKSVDLAHRDEDAVASDAGTPPTQAIDPDVARPSIRAAPAQPGVLKAGSGIVICCEPGRVLALRVDANGEAVRIELEAEREISCETGSPAPETEASVVGAIEEIITGLPRRRRTAHLMVLEPIARHRLLHLPPLKGRRLRNLARFSFSGETPMESRYCVQGDSYEGQDKGLAVRAAGIPESLMREIRRVALVNHCKLKRICTRPVGGPALVELFGEPEASRGRYMLIELRHEFLRLSLLADGTVRFSRSVEVPGGSSSMELATRIVTEVQRTNIYVGGRFREKPGDHLVLLTDGDSAMDDLAEHLRNQLRAPLFCIHPRLRVSERVPPGRPNLLVDASSLVIRHEPAPLGAFNMRPASLRWLAFAAVAVSITISVLVGGPLLERGQRARLTVSGNRERLETLERERAALPDRRSELADAVATRSAMVGRLGDLIPLLPPEIDAATLARDLLARIPPEIIVRRLSIKRAGDQGAGGTVSRRNRRVVVISGHSTAALDVAAARSPAILASLTRSPYVLRGRDASGMYDPFAIRKSGKVPLYPVKFRLVVEDPR